MTDRGAAEPAPGRCDATTTASAGVARAVGLLRSALRQLPPDA